MGKLAIAFVVAIVLVSCATRPAVFATDVDAWSGVPVIELETHPGYAARPRQVRQLSDGSQMWTYSNCIQRQQDIVCSAGPVWGTNVTRCSGGGTHRNCCYSSFRIADGKVASLDVTGECKTECKSRPRSNPCTQAELAEHDRDLD